MLKYYRLRDYNFILLFLLLAISIVGVLLVGSADASLRNRQLAGVVVGLALMIFISLLDYSWILGFYWIIYGVNIAFLLLVYFRGATRKGAARWIAIGGENGFQFQPTELTKIMLILFFAMYFMRHDADLNSFKRIIQSVLLLALPLLLVISQPDLKNTITLSLVFSFLYFAAGLSYKRIGAILLILVPLALILLFLITQTDLKIVDSYQKQRIMTFLEPDNDEYSESALQQENSIMAIGSGQLTGKGLNNNEVSSANKGNFVAEIKNDFIFAVAGEELGFIGCTAIVALLFLIVLQCLYTGRHAKNKAGTLVCSGMGALIAVQSFINIGVATGLLPNTGTTLPFVSYGLTSLFSMYIGMGFVLNISLQKKRVRGGDIVYEKI